MYRVLIADDEYWVGRWLADVLAKSPYDIKLAGISKNGGEALEKLKSDQIDILITDINMPVASGLALLKELEESGRKKPKTIIISGYDEFEYARQAIELDVLAYLLKPLEREKVYEAVEKAIGLLEEEQRQRESETSDFAGTVEVVLAEYLKNPESDLKEKLAELFVRRDYDLTGCLNFYFVLTGDVIKLLNDCYGKENDTEYLSLMEEGYELSVRIKNHYSIRSICKRFEDYTRKVISCLKEDEYLAVSDIVRKVLLLIREKYAQDLSLGQIADEYGVNPSYFSKKFKDETGCNFIDYLTAVRMEQARALLENTALPVAAVSSRVGFREAKYFSRVFSSVMGMKPTEYRERMRRDGTGREVEM